MGLLLPPMRPFLACLSIPFPVTDNTPGWRQGHRERSGGCRVTPMPEKPRGVLSCPRKHTLSSTLEHTAGPRLPALQTGAREDAASNDRRLAHFPPFLPTGHACNTTRFVPQEFPTLKPDLGSWQRLDMLRLIRRLPPTAVTARLNCNYPVRRLRRSPRFGGRHLITLNNSRME